LIIARDEVSLSSHVVMMPTHVANSACALATIRTCVGLIGFGLVLLTMDQSFLILKFKVSLCFYILKQDPFNLKM
jgi:uncharacterized membrane protein YidH (DUF202 family)